MVDQIVDGPMTGHASIGQADRLAVIAEATNTPIMLQKNGGTINQGFQAYEAAVFKMATLDHCNLARQWTDDVTNETLPIVDGHVPVPKVPGLGITLNYE